MSAYLKESSLMTHLPFRSNTETGHCYNTMEDSSRFSAQNTPVFWFCQRGGSNKRAFNYNALAAG